MARVFIAKVQIDLGHLLENKWSPIKCFSFPQCDGSRCFLSPTKSHYEEVPFLYVDKHSGWLHSLVSKTSDLSSSASRNYRNHHLRQLHYIRWWGTDFVKLETVLGIFSARNNRGGGGWWRRWLWWRRWCGKNKISCRSSKVKQQ